MRSRLLILLIGLLLDRVGRLRIAAGSVFPVLVFTVLFREFGFLQHLVPLFANFIVGNFCEHWRKDFKNVNGLYWALMGFIVNELQSTSKGSTQKEEGVLTSWSNCHLDGPYLGNLPRPTHILGGAQMSYHVVQGSSSRVFTRHEVRPIIAHVRVRIR